MKSVTWSQPNKACFTINKYKKEGRETHKQAAAEVAAVKTLQRISREKVGDLVTAFRDVHGFQTSMTAKVFKRILIFKIMLVCPLNSFNFKI